MIPVSWIVAGVAVAALGGYYAHCEHVKRDRAAFVAKVKAEAEAAVRKAQEIAHDNEKAKEKADADTARLRASNTDLAARLRAARAASGYLPPASPGAKRPERIAFDRAELHRALEYLDERGAGIAAEGDAGRIELDAARRWAAERK